MRKKKTFLIAILLIFVSCTAVAQDLTNHRQIATRYHHKFENRKTSSGERFSQKKYTAAHKSIKLGTYVLVVDTVTNKWVIVKVNDRCPRRNVIDLAAIAADRIGLTPRKGVSRVLITTLGDDAETLWLQQDTMSDEYHESLEAFFANPTADENKTTPVKTKEKEIASNKTPQSAAPVSKPTVNKNKKETPPADGFKSTRLYISQIEDTKRAEELLEEMQPSVALNAKILNDTDSIQIEIIMSEEVEKFETKFKKKYPQYKVVKVYNYQK